MEENVIREIHYLTHLIESHEKKKVLDNLHCVKKPIVNNNLILAKSENCVNTPPTQHSSQTVNNTVCNKSRSTNVYINPNFKPQSSAIYINPKLHKKPLVHVNRKMMRDIIKTNENVQNNSINVTNTSTKQNLVENQISVKKSIHVNPKLMKKLSSPVQSKPTEHKEIIKQNVTHPVCSRLKFVKNSPKVTLNQRKTSNSNILVLSRRKLVRVKQGTRRSSSASQVELRKVKKPSNLIVTNVKPVPQKIVKAKVINTLQQSINKDNLKSPIVKPKVNKYRIDRTIPKKTSTRAQTGIGQKKTVDNKMELITIGGIVYKSSKNHLVRNSYGVKKKRSINLKADKFIVTTNGKKLCRVKPVKEVSGNLSTKTPQKINYKNNISNKVKQRSIQILRNKMQKNNQPCLIFQKFGYCSNHEKGICQKRHDKKQISLCKKFLQGNCLLDKCPLSHDVGPEKMPTCKYFLEGCCTKDACPYRHIKVSSSTPICIDFLRGYCAKGSECKQRHENLCPEFNKTKKCSKGKNCPYPHKIQTSSKKQNHLRRKYDVANIRKDSSSSSTENRLRYYEQEDTINNSLDKKRENIMKKVKLMKRVESVARSNTSTETPDNDTNSKIITNSDELEIVSSPKALKRPPIGVLPAYIPFD